jgi:transposase
MLEVEVNHQIILLHYREGLSLRQIAKKLKIHRKTVTARIVEYEQLKPALQTMRATLLLF